MAAIGHMDMVLTKMPCAVRMQLRDSSVVWNRACPEPLPLEPCMPQDDHNAQALSMRRAGMSRWATWTLR